MKSLCGINRSLLSFTCGFALGQLYYNYLLKKLPLSQHIGAILSLLLSFFLGILNVISVQVRCISLLCLPMYCGKVGRGVLKAVVLTYIVAGPIINMSLNAKEVVRVFACSTRLSYNLSHSKYILTSGPLKRTVLSLRTEVERTKDTFRYLQNVINPIINEIEGSGDATLNEINDYIDELSDDSDATSYTTGSELETYIKKLRYRCESQLSAAVVTCNRVFSTAHNNCCKASTNCASWMLCWPLKLTNVCNFLPALEANFTCDKTNQVKVDEIEAYIVLKNVFREITQNLKDIHLQYKLIIEQQLWDLQDAKETGESVLHAYEEKTIIMRTAIIIMNVCMAILFLRIVVAAITYHDMYLTHITYDNIYVTDYFKTLDERRRKKNKFHLLPLKKMERIKYIDVLSLTYITRERGKLITQILKVMLEVITATTFVMLDRLFYEALDVVRQHAMVEIPQQDSDLDIQVKGGGILATMLRKLISNLNAQDVNKKAVNNEECFPRPRLMPTIYFLKIYGGYLWILLLVFVNPYTLRLRRLICSYFYKRREKQRILHLYNDILKKRMKMEKTLRRKAVQAVRAHYLSGENLLSLRIKFPQILSWLRILPAARMTCLICSETQPRNESLNSWHSCAVSKCPFVYCSECWYEIGERCLACDPSLAELSDIDSLSEDEHVEY
ncbi:hypothetical protein K1T71_010407 [Dendrolimus kikuchii]|uniref:Uncharacterized protein n=1 Tax=Dendrolimus kikuchii TaxID=765133 RepID=A0ACC1CRV3_9NEOP|nr:hypothetical protein K1T71_010407 [Dendrolimus kikuchii]